MATERLRFYLDENVPTDYIHIPTHYIYTTSKTADVDDIQACIDLLTGLLSNEIDI